MQWAERHRPENKEIEGARKQLSLVRHAPS